MGRDKRKKQEGRPYVQGKDFEEVFRRVGRFGEGKRSGKEKVEISEDILAG